MDKGGGRIFYGWYVVAVAFLANFMATGTHFYVFNAFMEPLEQVRGFTRAQVNLGLTMGGMAGLLAQLAHGTLVMRIGPRKYMAAGAALSAAVFAALGRAETLLAFYGLYVLLFFSNGAFCGIVANTAVNNWFVKKRGRAMGLSVMGISLAGVLVPYIALFAYRSLGLSGAFTLLASMIALLAPLSLLVVRDRPEDYGLLPDGEAEKPRPERGEPPPAEPEPLWPVSAVVRTGAFWQTGLAFAACMAGVVGVMSQMAPRFMDIGLSPKLSMGLLGAAALLGAAGKYAWGALCDKFDPRRVALAMFLANAAGLLLALFWKTTAGAVAFALVFGFSMGGVLALLPVMVAHLFGRLSFTSISRFIALFLVLQNLGFLVMGASYGATGSYDAAYAVFLGLNLLAAVLVFFLRKPGPPEHVSAVDLSPRFE
ncbi:MAG: MFS transporter [Deltaproteobacteria bacterium]|nr:MFS transporter [Deltaproteobacteria bacterium]